MYSEGYHEDKTCTFDKFFASTGPFRDFFRGRGCFIQEVVTEHVAEIPGVNILDPPLPCQYGLWYMDDPMQLVLGLGTIPASGVAEFPGIIPSTPPAPYTVYLQGVIDFGLTNLCPVNVQ